MLGMNDLSKSNLEKLKLLPSSNTDTNTNTHDSPTDNTNTNNNNNNNDNNKQSNSGDKQRQKDDNIRLSSLYNKGVVVVDAFEGYAYDNNIRVGDRILAIDGKDTTHMSVDEVRNLLRGEPGTDISITLERDQYTPTTTSYLTSTTSSPTSTFTSPTTSSSSSSSGSGTPGKVIKTVNVQRQQVKMSDVRLATYLGPVKDGIGYISLAGFNADASRDFASAFLMLRYSAPFGLNGLILDLRGNPGGLLDAAVDIASYLVPADSNIVSAKAKNDPEVIFKSTLEPIRPAGMKLAVLVNGGSASASEIVSGAIQDLDAGVILGMYCGIALYIYNIHILRSTYILRSMCYIFVCMCGIVRSTYVWTYRYDMIYIHVYMYASYIYYCEYI